MDGLAGCGECAVGAGGIGRASGESGHVTLQGRRTAPSCRSMHASAQDVRSSCVFELVLFELLSVSARSLIGTDGIGRSARGQYSEFLEKGNLS